MINFKLKIARILQYIVSRIHAGHNEEEYRARITSVRDFLHETLPSIDDSWKDKAIMEGGIEGIGINYYIFPDNTLPKYTFIIPEVPLYICVLDIKSASWDEARDRGISRLEWEIEQGKIPTIIEITNNLSTVGNSILPKILVIKWSDSVNHLELIDRINLKANK